MAVGRAVASAAREFQAMQQTGDGFLFRYQRAISRQLTQRFHGLEGAWFRHLID